MTNIVVLIKQVPDTWSERKLTDGDFTLDREAADAVLDEINERADWWWYEPFQPQPPPISN